MGVFPMTDRERQEKVQRGLRLLADMTLAQLTNAIGVPHSPISPEK